MPAAAMPAAPRPRVVSPRRGPGPGPAPGPGRGRRARALALAVVATSLVSGGVARADEADDRHAEGTALGKKGEFEAARIKLLQAASARPMAKTLLNLCVVEQQMKLEDEAIKHCRAFLAAKDADPATAQTVHDGIFRELEQVTGRVVIEAPTGARVEVDGHLLGVAPFPGPVDLKVGERTFSAGTVSVSVAVRPGQVATAKLVVDEPSPAPPPVVGQPASPQPTPPPAAPAERGSWLVPGVLGGLGVVGLGVGGGLALASSGKASNLEAARATRAGTCGPTGAECADLQSVYDSGKGLRTGSYIAYGVGGAALLGAVVVALVTTPWRERQAATRSTPTPTLVPVFGAAPGVALLGAY